MWILVWRIPIFPRIFESYLGESIIKRAIAKKLVRIKTHNLRQFTRDKHKTVDDAPYGGGAGMVMKIEPIYRALRFVSQKRKKRGNNKVILLTPGGKQFTQKIAQDYSKLQEITLICGRYEGIDARVKYFIDEEISIGPYILNGGEVAAMVILESIFRLLPGVLGNNESLREETFVVNNSKSNRVKKIFIEYPQYTRPAVFVVKGKRYSVPKVLLSGNHHKIKEWRDQQLKSKTIKF